MENAYRPLLGEVRDVCFLMQQEEIVFVSDYGADLFGYSKNELIGKSMLELLAPEEREWFLAFHKCKLAGQSVPQRYETVILKKSGVTIPVEISDRLTYYNDQPAVSGIVTEITERKKVLDNLWIGERKWHSIVANVPGAVVVVNPDNTIQFTSRTVSGIQFADVIGKSMYDYISSDYKGMVMEAIQKVYDTGKSSSYQIRGVGPGNSISWYEGQVGPLILDGQVVATTHIIIDVTERKQMEEALRESAEKLRLTFEYAPIEITVRDLNGIITQVNDQTLKLRGVISKDELIGQSGLKFVARHQREMAIREFYQLLEEGSIKELEYTMVKTDGSEIIVQSSAGVIRGASGKPVGFITITKDVTEQKRLIENEKFYITESIKAQENARRRLARALHDDTIQEMLLAMHRLQDAIGGTYGILPSRANDHLEEIRLLIERIVAGLRKFTTDLRPDILDDMGLTSALRWLTDRLIKEDGIKTKFSLVGKERRLSPEMELNLFRIAQEALSNVHRHASASTVVLNLEFNEQKVAMSISDDGRGFELPSTLSHFTKQHKLGLTGITERVHLLGGGYRFETSPGKGTVIKIEISG